MGKAQIFSPLKNFFFPPLCFHCDEPAHPLCESCLQLLEMLPHDPKLALATFEAQGPAWSLMKALKSGKAPRLAKGLAGYMALQYLKNDLPMPDLIVPVPQSLFRSLQVGYNPSLLLAQHLGKTLDRPVLELLKRKRQLFSQMRVDQDRRYLLSAQSFEWKKAVPIARKTLLLIDDVVGTGTTLHACSQKLHEGFPLRVIKMACLRQELTINFSEKSRL